MGKGRNRNKDKDPYTGPEKSGRNDYDSDDSCSTGFHIDDDLTSVQGDIENLDDVLDKLSENLENAQHKNISIRTAAISGLIYALTSQYLPSFVSRNKMTIITLCNKLDNKTAEEAHLLAKLLAIVSIQSGDGISDLLVDPLSQMRTILMDCSKSIALRAICACSLAITSRMSCIEDEIINANINACRFAWTNIKPSTNNSTLFSIALGSWCLLLLDGDHQAITSAIADQPKLVGFLSSDQLEVRIAAGEALAFLHEFMEETRPAFKFPNQSQVLEVLDSLIGDISKRKTKKEKRVQRFTFREIYSFMSGEDNPPEVKIKFGSETLLLDTCSIKLFYDLCCEILHGGIMRHLQFNEVIREVFDLGPVRERIDVAASKTARIAIHDAAEKYRKQARGKQRDKRSVVF